MEVKNNKELRERLQDIFDEVKVASHTIESGKEVVAHRQLQGTRAKLVTLIEWVIKEFPDVVKDAT